MDFKTKQVIDIYPSRLKEFQEFGKLLNHWRNEIKNSFIRVNVRIKDKKGNFIIVKKGYLMVLWKDVILELNVSLKMKMDIEILRDSEKDYSFH